MEFGFSDYETKKYNFDTLKCPQRAENMNSTLHQENAKYSYTENAK